MALVHRQAKQMFNWYLVSKLNHRSLLQQNLYLNALYTHFSDLVTDIFNAKFHGQQATIWFIASTIKNWYCFVAQISFDILLSCWNLQALIPSPMQVIHPPHFMVIPRRLLLESLRCLVNQIINLEKWSFLLIHTASYQRSHFLLLHKSLFHHY